MASLSCPWLTWREANTNNREEPSRCERCHVQSPSTQLFQSPALRDFNPDILQTKEPVTLSNHPTSSGLGSLPTAQSPCPTSDPTRTLPSQESDTFSMCTVCTPLSHRAIVNGHNDLLQPLLKTQLCSQCIDNTVRLVTCWELVDFWTQSQESTSLSNIPSPL